MPGRRSFLIGCGSMVALPALGGTVQPIASSNAPELDSSGVALEQPEFSGPHNLAFRIDGWESFIESQPSRDGRPWIRITSMWRTAWR